MKVKDLMSTNIVCVSESTPASQIAGQMRKSNIGSLPVCDQNNHIKGIITDRDLTLRVLARYEAKRNASAGNTAAHEDIKNADSASGANTRDPNNNASQTNSTNAATNANSAKGRNKNASGSNAGGETDAKDIAEMTAAEIMTTNPVVVSPNANIHDAALLFAAHKVRRLPVTEASKVVGILSLGDIAAKPIYIDEAGDALSAISLADGLQSEN